MDASFRRADFSQRYLKQQAKAAFELHCLAGEQKNNFSA